MISDRAALQSPPRPLTEHKSVSDSKLSPGTHTIHMRTLISHMHTCDTNVLTHTRVCAHTIHMCTSCVKTHTCMHVHNLAHEHMLTHAHSHAHVCAHTTFVYVCMCIPMHTLHMHTHLACARIRHTQVCTQVHTYACTHVCTHLHAHTWWVSWACSGRRQREARGATFGNSDLLLGCQGL